MKLRQSVTRQKKKKKMFTEVLLSPETKRSVNKPTAVNFSEWQESYRLNNQPTVTRPWRPTLIKKLIVTQQAGKFPPFTGNRRFMTQHSPLQSFIACILAFTLLGSVLSCNKAPAQMLAVLITRQT
jgi:hypothetical protein